MKTFRFAGPDGALEFRINKVSRVRCRDCAPERIVRYAGQRRGIAEWRSASPWHWDSFLAMACANSSRDTAVQ